MRNLGAWLVDGRQPGRHYRRALYVVESHEADVVRHLEAQLSERLLEFDGRHVVSADDCLRLELPYIPPDGVHVGRLSLKHHVAVAFPKAVEDGADKPIYYDHGISGRNFGTYIGSTPDSARLYQFRNDRKERETDTTVLTGAKGAPNAGGCLVMWPGRSLRLKVYQVDGDGKITDSPVSGAQFTLTNIHDVDDTEDDVQVWSDVSDAKGEVTIYWGCSETADGGTASLTSLNLMLRAMR